MATAIIEQPDAGLLGANHAGWAGRLTLPPGVSREFLLEHHLCPLQLDDDGKLRLAIDDTTIPAGIDDLELAYGAVSSLVKLPPEEVQLMIERLAAAAERMLDVAPDVDTVPSTDVRDLAYQPPVVRYVNLLVRDAFEAGASDIHLESGADGMDVRFRVDGILTEALAPPREFEQPVISRIKLLADLDISDRRHPQDGSIRVRFDNSTLDLRVSTVPTLHGESVVLRLLERAGRRGASLDELGMSSAVLETLRRIALRPHGMILVTGPTGSGKTTTLYATLSLRDAAREKIITVEDPVEHSLPGVMQVPVHTQANVGFATVLRSILRQDPDVLMVGEMRDAETAEIAVKAALTGHVVLSTLHTNSAAGAIPRLMDLGLEPFIIAGTLDAVLAQRLVRRICNDCRSPYEPASVPADAAKLFSRANGTFHFTRGGGCRACRHTGFRGRVGLFELLAITSEIRDAIASKATGEMLRDLAVKSGMVTLRVDGWMKVFEGTTTIEEVMRVTS